MAKITSEKRKLFIVAVLLTSFIFVFAACGDSGDTESTEAQEATEATESAVVDEEVADIEVVESGYNVRDDATVVYGYIIRNPNETVAFEYPMITVNVCDANGDVIASNTDSTCLIQPGEVQALYGHIECEGADPAKIEVIPEAGEEISPSDEAIKSSDLTISDTNEVNDDGSVKITGKVKNDSASDTSSIALTALFRKDGKIVSGGMAFLEEDLSAGQEIEFEIDEYYVPEHDSFDVIAMNWEY